MRFILIFFGNAARVRRSSHCDVNGLVALFSSACTWLLGRRGVPASGDTLELQVTQVTLDSGSMK
jgi:hypothetical protein